MAFSFISSAAILYKAGANVSTTLSAGSLQLAQFCAEAEAEVCTRTRQDWNTDYSSVGANFKNILGDVVADIVCMKCIAYDMSGFTSKVEAQTMLDYLKDVSDTKIKALTDDKIKEVLGV